MSIKINSGYSGFSGPSQDYYKATQRFNQILNQKLNTTGKASEALDGSAAMRGVNISDVTMASGASAAEINNALKGTDMEGLGESFVKAEKESGVNAWFLTGLAAHESAYGSSRIAKDKNNLFGFMAYDNSPYQSAKYYDSTEDSILDVASYLSKAYLSEDGKYYNGTAISDIGKKYATDPNWANAIENHLRKMIGG